MKIAITGTPLSGKTTLFCGLATLNYHQHISSGQKTKTATIKVRDQRLIEIHKIDAGQKKIVFPEFEIVDTEPLHIDPPDLEANRKILAQIRNYDGILFAVGVYNVQAELRKKIEFVSQQKKLLTETLLTSDLELLEHRIQKIEGLAKRRALSPEEQKEMDLLKLIQDAVINKKFDLLKTLAPADIKKFKGFGLFFEKPLLTIINISEQDIEYAEQFSMPDSIATCLKFETELSTLTDEEKAEFMNLYNINELRLPSLPLQIYKSMRQIIFFTIGKDEVAGWGIPENSTSVEAAGKIHSDMAKGFICAEVINYQDFIKCGSIKAAQAIGRVKTQGKDYQVQDGDIMHFKFSV